MTACPSTITFAESKTTIADVLTNKLSENVKCPNQFERPFIKEINTNEDNVLIIMYHNCRAETDADVCVF